jgi:hypothetical protein
VGQTLQLPEAKPDRAPDHKPGLIQVPTPQTLTVVGELAPSPVPTLPASQALARGYVFVVFEQLPDIGSTRIVRKVAVIPRDFSLRPKKSGHRRQHKQRR